MKMKPTRYLWFKYSLAVVLLILLLFLVEVYSLKVGPWLLVLLGARSIAEPVQIHWLAKKGKFDDLTYITKRNKLNVIVGVLVVSGIIAAYFVLTYHLFWVGSLTLEVLLILAVFVGIDFGCDFFTYYQLKQEQTREQ
jgi:phosphatidylglycerophosphate synthase